MQHTGPLSRPDADLDKKKDPRCSPTSSEVEGQGDKIDSPVSHHLQPGSNKRVLATHSILLG